MTRHPDPIRANGIGDVLGSRFGIILVALVGLFIYWQSNQKDVPFAPGKKQLNTMSIDQEIKLGAESYLQILQGEQQQGNTDEREKGDRGKNGPIGHQSELPSTIQVTSAAIPSSIAKA